MLVGRGRERERIDQLLAGANSGRSGALVLRGEPGIGKSSLLRHAIEQATQWKVLWATGIETESELPFSGLAELFHPILDQLDEIPAPQAAALGGALAVGPPVVADPFTIYAATLSLIASAAERTPVLAVIDDAHWLDASSCDALLFAARRLHADRVVLLFAARTGERLLFDAPGVPELRLEGL
ncbi:MAG: ATP-binding protein, partial [Candidatus Dormibacteraeota bacterium]|nr:ATP-binding protein [Candidatus Dormibacteraeota bacterium]